MHGLRRSLLRSVRRSVLRSVIERNHERNASTLCFSVGVDGELEIIVNHLFVQICP